MLKIGYIMQAGAPDVRLEPRTGPATHVWEVCQKLRDRGHDVKLLAMWGREQIWTTTDFVRYERVQVRGLEAGPLRLLERAVRRIQSEFRLPYAAFFTSLRFAAACRRELDGYDVLYERMGWFGYGGALASRWLRIPLVLEVNGDHLTEFEALGIAPRGMQRILSVGLTAWSTRRASQVVAAGEGWREKFLERWPVDPSHVSVAENGSSLLDLLAREELRAFQSLSNPGERVRVAFVGGFQPWQGIETLLRAFHKSLAQGVAAQLVVMGGGQHDMTESLVRLVRDLQLEQDVVFAGYLAPKALAAELAQSDIAVSPYCGRREFSGLKLLDYKSAGLPTIASGQNGEPAILQHGHTGLIIPPCNEECLAEALVHLYRNPDLRRRMGRSARLEAEVEHSWKRTAGEVEEVILRATGRAGAKTRREEARTCDG